MHPDRPGSPPGWAGTEPPRGNRASQGFLADRWMLDDRNIRQKVGITTILDPAGLHKVLCGAITRTWHECQTRTA